MRWNFASTRTQFILFSFLLAGVAFASSAKSTPAHSDSAPMFPDATMNKAYTADHLYTCPMHAEVVSADPELDCPLCGMHLEEIPAEKVVELRTEELYGCPMCAIVRFGEDVEKGCPVCGMDLISISHDCKSMHDHKPDHGMMENVKSKDDESGSHEGHGH